MSLKILEPSPIEAAPKTKLCRRCGETKDLLAFYSGGKGGSGSWCKACFNQYRKDARVGRIVSKSDRAAAKSGIDWDMAFARSKYYIEHTQKPLDSAPKSINLQSPSDLTLWEQYEKWGNCWYVCIEENLQ